MPRELTIDLKVLDNHYQIDNVTIRIIDNEKKTQLDFYYQAIFISEVDDFPFVALSKLRLKLESIGLKLVCQGSRKDVHPSGTQLIGFYAYELEMSKSSENSVYILDNTDSIEKISTVKEQEDYFEEWLKSLGFNDQNINLNDPHSTIGSYWYVVNLENWNDQSEDFKQEIKSLVNEELHRIKEFDENIFSDLKTQFDKKFEFFRQ